MLLHDLSLILVLLILMVLLVGFIFTLWQNRRNIPPGLAAATVILALLLAGFFIMGFVIL